MHTTPRRLARPQWHQLEAILWKLDNAKRPGAELLSALATWEAGAKHRGFSDARAMLAAGPAPLGTSTLLAGLAEKMAAVRAALGTP